MERAEALARRQAEVDAIRSAAWSGPTLEDGTGVQAYRLEADDFGVAVVETVNDSLGRLFWLTIKMADGNSEFYHNNELGNTLKGVKEFARSRMYDL